MEDYRYYIKHSQRYDSYLSKLSVSSGNSEYISLFNYSPNVFSYPLSWTSKDSMRDYIHNAFMMHYSNDSYCQIDWNVIQDFQNMKVMKCYGKTADPIKMYDEYSINPELMLREAAWTYNAYRIFTPKITEAYEDLTKMPERNFGQQNYNTNVYYVDLFNNYSDRIYLLTSITNLGVYYSMPNENIITILSDEDLNLCRLSIPDFCKSTIFHSRDLQSLEIEMAYSSPIRLHNSQR